MAAVAAGDNRRVLRRRTSAGLCDFEKLKKRNYFGRGCLVWSVIPARKRKNRKKSNGVTGEWVVVHGQATNYVGAGSGRVGAYYVGI